MEEAIKQADRDISSILSEYSGWSDKFEIGKVHYATYDDLIEFVNARLETVRSCQILLKEEQVADTLGINRSLLENYLLFILVCRGTKYFRLGSFKGKKDYEIRQILKREQKKIGNNNLLAVELHPKLEKHLMYVFEGIQSKNQPEYKIPLHYFSFKDFDPETLRLDSENYFVYHHEKDDTLKAKRKQWKSEQEFIYRNYLSHDAVLNCLKINDIADNNAVHRIEAHYTYLGRFLHPTNRTFQELRERSNHHSNQTMVGFDHHYERVAVLLAYCYVIHNALGFLEELAGVFDKAPKDYLKNSSASSIKNLIAELQSRYSYFWYIFNGPSDWDKFDYVIYHVSDEELKNMGGDYRNVDPAIVTFHKSIYRRFNDVFRECANNRVGKYQPPF